MAEAILPHQRPNRSRLEEWRTEIIQMRSLDWPYSRIAQWLTSEKNFPISREAVRQYCVLRGIAKGGSPDPLEKDGVNGVSASRTQVPKSAKKKPKAGARRKFEYDDSRPIDRWGSESSEIGGTS